jgi:arylsulfatase A-like enzyme
MRMIRTLSQPRRWVLCVVLVIAYARAAGPAYPEERTPARPNVLFIAIDDLNDWVGCLGGHPQARTPHMDRLAERGVLFTNAHCAAPVCLASRTALFCGRAPHVTGVWSNWNPTKGRPPARELQLPVQLSAAGYETLGTGKLYHNDATKLFDAYFDTEQRWSPFGAKQVRYTDAELPSKGSDRPRHVVTGGPGGRDWVLPLNGLPSERNAGTSDGESFDWGPVAVSDAEMGDVQVTDWGMARLREPRPRPFFLGVGYYRPHIPLFAPERDFAVQPSGDAMELPRTLATDLDDIGPQGRELARDAITAGTHGLVVQHQQWPDAVRAYLACVTFVDRQIGRLIDELDRSPHAENTWVVLWSDHGWQLGEKEHWGKWTGWRQSTRVPLIVVPPRRESAARGRRCDAAVSLLDLYPTVAEICGLEPRSDLDGESLLPLLADPDRKSDRVVLTSFGPGNYALSGRGWRYIRYSGGEEELYQIDRDPQEFRNLSGDAAHRQDLERMRSELARRHLPGE